MFALKPALSARWAMCVLVALLLLTSSAWQRDSLAQAAPVFQEEAPQRDAPPASYAQWPPRPEPVDAAALAETAGEGPGTQTFPDDFPSYCPGGITEGAPDPAAWIRYTFQSMKTGNWEIVQKNGCVIEKFISLTNHPAYDGMPNVNKDGSRIVFVSDRDGNDEIYSMAANGTDLRRLTNNAATDTYPVWSPDGSMIAFSSDRTGKPQNYVMNADGSGVRRLVVSNYQDLSPTWRPDGSKITWVRILDSRTGLSVLYSANIDGANITQQTPGLSYLDHPVWSPDGLQLSFTYDSNGDSWFELGVMNANGSNLRPLNDCHVFGQWDDCHNGGWGENSRFIIYSKVSYTVQNQQFVVAAMDIHFMPMAGNGENPIPTYFAYYPSVTYLDRLAPYSALVSTIPEYSDTQDFHPSVFGQDTGSSGLWAFQIIASESPEFTQYTSIASIGFPDEPPTYSGVAETRFNWIDRSQMGKKLYLRSQAIDWAYNFEPVVTQPAASTTFYEWAARGLITDQRGIPLSGASGIFSQAVSPPVNSPLSNGQGIFEAFFTDGNNTPFVQIFRTGHTSPEQTQWYVTNTLQDYNFSAVLPTGINLLTNGQFETPVTDAWQSGGGMAISNSNIPHSGERSGMLGVACANELCLERDETFPIIGDDYALEGDAQGTLHITTLQSKNLVYFSRDSAGNVSAPEIVYSYPDSHSGFLNSDLNLYVSTDGTRFILFPVQDTSTWRYTMYLAVKPVDGSWTAEEVPMPEFSSGGDGKTRMTVDDTGRVHAVYFHNQPPLTDLYYIVRAANGTWSQPLRIASTAQSGSRYLSIIGGRSDEAYILYLLESGTVTTQSYHLVHILADGRVSPPEPLPDIPITNNALLSMGSFMDGVIDSQGNLHLLIFSHYMSRSSAGVWSTPISDDFRSGGRPLDLNVDANGTVSVLVNETKYLEKPAGADQFNAWEFNSLNNRFSSVEILDGQRIFLRTSWSVDRNVNHVYRPVVLDQPVDGTLNQQVTIPENYRNPTLSFMYRVQMTLHAGADLTSVVSVRVNGVEVQQYPLALGEWQHAWIDFRPWAGQTVVVSFGLLQAANEPLVQLLIDEAVLSDWTTPIITSISSDHIHYPWSQPVSLTLQGQNFGPNSMVNLDGTQIAPDALTETEITFTLPQNLLLGPHIVTVVTPGGVEAAAPVSIRVGEDDRVTFIPMVFR